MPGPLSGLIPASHTPFHTDGRLNLEAVDQQAALMRESGLKGVFIAGTTGEYASLSVAERKDLAAKWVEAAKGSIKVAVHVGHNCQNEARELAAHAKEVGAAAVAVVAPNYFRPARVEELVDFCAPIAAEAAPLPFYFYDIPSMSGVRVAASEFLARARERIPNLQGLKFSNNDLVELQECVRFDGGAFDVLFGWDECLLAGLCLGVRGAVGSTYNFAAPVAHRIAKAFESGDIETARAEQVKLVRLVRALEKYGFLPASKVVMTMLGVDCGPARSPLRNLSPAEKLELWEALSKLDVFPRPLRRPE